MRNAPPAPFEVAVEAQTLGDGEHVDALLGGSECLDGCIYLLIGRVVERFGLEDVAHHCVGVLLEHQRSEHGFFEVVVAGRDASPVVKLRYVLRLGCASVVIVICIIFLWHLGCDCFCLCKGSRFRRLLKEVERIFYDWLWVLR